MHDNAVLKIGMTSPLHPTTAFNVLSEEEKKRVSDHIKAAEPSYESVIKAVGAK